MKYILTKAELNYYRETAAKAILDNKENMQYLCTQVAIHMPVNCDDKYTEGKAPHGCILDKETHPGYCGGCPVTEICPHEGKEWAK